MTTSPTSPAARVVLPPLAAPVDQLWHTLLDLSESLRVDWTIVGGQMVLLHALEHGETVTTLSQDGDIVADVRADQHALKAVVAALEVLGFSLAGMSTDQLAHRYQRAAQPRPVVVDLLAPDGLGETTDLTTTPPGRTLQAAAGTQLLLGSERIEVVHDGRAVLVPRPNLLAAIVGKAQACSLPDPARHLRDLALLCSLVADPFEMADQLIKKDRQRLRRARALGAPDHPAWLLLRQARRQAGHITFEVLLDA